jgi:DNA polymerase-3 subunit alpha
LRRQSEEGLEHRLARIGLADGYSEADYRERLKTELDIIENMKFPGYFLIVADFIKWAKDQDIPVGPGRGSGAGSLVAYALTITDVDPLRFSLLFERFLNPARVSMPDFDIDFCQDRRDEVIRYVVRTNTAAIRWPRSSRSEACRPAPRCAMSAAYWKCPTGWSTGSASWCPTIRPIRRR